MNSIMASKSKSRALGIAFLIQGISSMASAAIWGGINKGPGNISQTLVNIASDPWPLRAYILGEMVTAAGVILLGAFLFVYLKRFDEKMALTAFGFYVLEGAIIAAGKLSAFSLFGISREFAGSQATHLLAMGRTAVELTDFTGTLLMWAFCLGGILFYYLLDKSRLVPSWLSLWGLFSVVLCLVGTVFAFLGHKLPFFIYFPYIPFEYTIGIYITIKGIKDVSAESA